MFCAYLSKESNLLFLPAFLLAVWAPRRSRRDVGLFIVAFAALALAEYLYYLLMVEGAWLGRLSKMAGHMRRMTTPDRLPPDHLGLTWLNLPLRRYAPSKVGGIAPAAAFYAACISAIYLLLRERRIDSTRAIVAYAFLSYVVINTYAVSGLDPLTPAQLFLSRYLAVLIPLMGVASVFAAGDIGAILSRLTRAVTSHRVGAFVGPVVTTLPVVALIYSFHDTNRSRYVTDVAVHPFVVLRGYQEVVNDARAQCAPFLVDSDKSQRIADRIFSDRFHRLRWEKLERSKFETVGFPDECSSRYPGVRAYTDAQARDGMVDAVFVATQNPEGSSGSGLFLERRRLPKEQLIR
jgi:hypothetical protein